MGTVYERNGTLGISTVSTSPFFLKWRGAHKETMPSTLQVLSRTFIALLDISSGNFESLDFTLDAILNPVHKTIIPPTISKDCTTKAKKEFLETIIHTFQLHCGN